MTKRIRNDPCMLKGSYKGGDPQVEENPHPQEKVSGTFKKNILLD